LLQLDSADGSTPADAAKIALFRESLQRYVGRHAFHNYAGRRKQYVPQKGAARPMSAVR
jgi:tRNA U38,U39,U40 pseudouridine synthase TruA